MSLSVLSFCMHRIVMYLLLSAFCFFHVSVSLSSYHSCFIMLVFALYFHTLCWQFGLQFDVSCRFASDAKSVLITQSSASEEDQASWQAANCLQLNYKALPLCAGGGDIHSMVSVACRVCFACVYVCLSVCMFACMSACYYA